MSFFFSSRRRHTRCSRDWSSDVCSSDLDNQGKLHEEAKEPIASWLVMPTEKATRQILRAIAKGKREAIITGHGKALVILERFLPWMLRAAGRKMAAGRGGYRAEPKSLRKIEEDES